MTTQASLVARIKIAERILRPTPVVKLSDLRIELFAKLEFLNGIGSLKDRPAFWILKRAIERGEISTRTTIVESSSGNFARALAVFARMLELEFIAVVDPNISPVIEASLLALCTRVIKVVEQDDTGGYLKNRLQCVSDLLADIPDAYWTNQYGNADAMEAHYHLTGTEILEALPKLDYVFVGVSSTGTIAGVSRRLKEFNSAVKVIAVDVEGSVIFANAPHRRLLPGLGSSIQPELLKYAFIDDVVIVSEAESVSACNILLGTHGLFVGGSTGSAYAAIQKYFDLHPSSSRPTVLFLCCDSGVGYLHNVYNPQWVISEFGTGDIAPQPTTVCS